jgi:RimJ/RimL family protein N-acetyltransferase
MLLRAYRQEDFSSLASLRQNTELQHLLLAYPQAECTAVDVEQWLERRSKDPAGFFAVIAENEDQPIGFAQISAIHHKGRYGYGGLALLPDYQGKGYGQKALALLENQARELNLRKLLLEIRADNAKAVSLYQRSGYQTVGHLKQHYYDGSQFYDAIIMEKLF